MVKGNRIFKFFRGAFLGDLTTEIHTLSNDDEHVLVHIQPGVIFKRVHQMSDRKFSMPEAELERIVSFLGTIRDWKSDYRCKERIFDGYGWDIIYHHRGYDFESGGYMAYPSNYREKVPELQTIIEDLWQKYDPDGYSPEARQERIEL